jgi:hypothetical protein
VFYRRPVWSPSNLRGVSVLDGYLWLALSFQLLFVAFLAALLSPAALVYAALGVTALVLAAILLTQRPSAPIFSASTVAGFLCTLAGLTAVSRPSLLPVMLALAFTATSLAATVVSATGARLSSRHE